MNCFVLFFLQKDSINVIDYSWLGFQILLGIGLRNSQLIYKSEWNT